MARGMRFAPEPNTGAGFPSHASRKTRRNPSGGSPPPYNTPWRATRVSMRAGRRRAQNQTLPPERTRTARRIVRERARRIVRERARRIVPVPVPIPAAMRLAVPSAVLPTTPPPRHRRRSSGGVRAQRRERGVVAGGGRGGPDLRARGAMTARGFPRSRRRRRGPRASRAPGIVPGERQDDDVRVEHASTLRALVRLVVQLGLRRNDSVTYSSSSPANRRPRTGAPRRREARARGPATRRQRPRGGATPTSRPDPPRGREAEAPRRAPTTATPARARRRHRARDRRPKRPRATPE